MANAFKGAFTNQQKHVHCDTYFCHFLVFTK